MLIDPFTIVAQIINFFILLVVLKLLLFDRVRRVMEEREQRIAERLSHADEQERKAEELAAELDRRLAATEQRREELLAEARADAQRRRDELVTQARADVDAQQARWERAVERDRERLVEQLRREVGEQVVGLTGQILRQLADDDLQDRLAAAFVTRLETLDEATREGLRNWAGEGDGRWVVATATRIEPELRERLTGLVRRAIGANVAPRFVTDPDLVAGIELRAGGRAVGWTIEGELGRFRDTMDELLGQHAGAGDDAMEEVTDEKDPAEGGTAAQARSRQRAKEAADA